MKHTTMFSTTKGCVACIGVLCNVGLGKPKENDPPMNEHACHSPIKEGVSSKDAESFVDWYFGKKEYWDIHDKTRAKVMQEELESLLSNARKEAEERVRKLFEDDFRRGHLEGEVYGRNKTLLELLAVCEGMLKEIPPHECDLGICTHYPFFIGNNEALSDLSTQIKKLIEGYDVQRTNR